MCIYSLILLSTMIQYLFCTQYYLSNLYISGGKPGDIYYSFFVYPSSYIDPLLTLPTPLTLPVDTYWLSCYATSTFRNATDRGWGPTAVRTYDFDGRYPWYFFDNTGDYNPPSYLNKWFSSNKVNIALDWAVIPFKLIGTIGEITSGPNYFLSNHFWPINIWPINIWSSRFNKFNIFVDFGIRR